MHKQRAIKYNFDEIIPRRQTNSIKWDAGDLLKKFGITERFDEDSIPLFVADMDFGCPQPVLDALKQRVNQKMFGYTTHLTDPEYFEAIQNWFRNRQQWEIKKKEIVYSPGTVFALSAAIKAFTMPGDKVIIQRPVYSPFTRVIEENKRIVANNELINNDGYYTIDFDDLSNKANEPGTKMMFLCSPHNPVGRIWQTDELRRIVEICQSNNIILISDEIHGDLIRNNETFYPVAPISDYPNIIVCTAINKTFNLAGLHCSNIIIRDEELQNTYQNEIGMQFPSPFSISALIAAYKQGEEWLDQLKVYIDENFDFLERFLFENMPKVRFRKPEGTYIGWMDFSAYGLSPKEVHNRIYNKANVVLEDGALFGNKSAHFQRICLPTPRSIIQKAMIRIADQF